LFSFFEKHLKVRPGLFFGGAAAQNRTVAVIELIQIKNCVGQQDPRPLLSVRPGVAQLAFIRPVIARSCHKQLFEV
jgi:hypothetical protein